MRRTAKGLLAAALACASVAALAASGDPEAGMKKSAPCQACHGAKGISVSPEFPNLAGQNEDYLVASLHHYKDGHRKNPIMQGQAANLTERDIHDLAAYFSGQEGLYTKE
ncbi:MAG TPA: cytochrome c [Usitatibacter sp.]|nr:cytochrome c [Usitatibacter sp.]